MTIWSAAVRIAPAAAAAISLTRASECKRSGKDAKAKCSFQGHSRAILHCQEMVRNKTNTREIVLPSVEEPRKKGGLLGQSHWIYRLVSSEDIHNVYELERELGQGGFAIVYLGRHKYMGYHRAVKRIPRGEDVNQEELMTEIYNLMDLDHPHIIKLSRTYDDGEFIYVVSELCSGPSLFDRIVEAPMTELQAGMALRHMLKAVQCCHSHYMGHYDVKPENFMYSDPECKKLKMIDLGLSSGFKHDVSQFKGTIAYMAPEVFCGMYGPEADVWSCGVVLFAMATQSSLIPLDASSEKVTALLQNRKWVTDRLAWASDKVSDDCRDMLHKMLCYDRHIRITAADALKHPFVSKTYNLPKRKKDMRIETAAFNVLKSMTDRFSGFGAEPVLVRAALSVMVHSVGYQTKETRSHRLAYSMLDRVGSGEISMDSIEATMPLMGLAIPENLHDAFRAVDLNLNGYITYGNFLAATLPLSLRCREDLCQRVFNLLDRNHDGFIDQDDLAATFLSKEETGNDEIRKLCQEAIAEVSSSTKINFDDFLLIMVGSHTPISTNGVAIHDGSDDSAT